MNQSEWAGTTDNNIHDTNWEEDIAIVVEGVCYKAFSVCLALRSDFFAGILRSSMVESQTRTIHLQYETNAEFEHIYPFLDLRRTQALDDAVQPSTLLFQLGWADKYGIEILRSSCEAFLIRDFTYRDARTATLSHLLIGCNYRLSFYLKSLERVLFSGCESGAFRSLIGTACRIFTQGLDELQKYHSSTPPAARTERTGKTASSKYSEFVSRDLLLRVLLVLWSRCLGILRSEGVMPSALQTNFVTDTPAATSHVIGFSNDDFFLTEEDRRGLYSEEIMRFFAPLVVERLLQGSASSSTFNPAPQRHGAQQDKILQRYPLIDYFDEYWLRFSSPREYQRRISILHASDETEPEEEEEDHKQFARRRQRCFPAVVRPD